MYKHQNPTFLFLLAILLLSSTFFSGRSFAQGNLDLKWSYYIGGDWTTGVVAAPDQTLYVSVFDQAYDQSRLVSINPDGTKKWQYTSSNYISAAAPTADGTSYISVYDHAYQVYLYALDNYNGKEKWGVRLNGKQATSPAISPDGSLYVSVEDDVYQSFLHAINPMEKKVRTLSMGKGESSKPVFGKDGTAYLTFRDYVNKNHSLLAISPISGIKWASTNNHAQRVSAPVMGSSGMIYVSVFNAVYNDPNNSQLMEFSSDQSKKLLFSTDYEIWQAPTPGPDGTLYLPAFNSQTKRGLFFAIAPDGTVKWSYESGYVWAPPVINPVEGTIYFPSYDMNSWETYLNALNPDGTLKWTSTLSHSIDRDPVIGPDGTIYIVSNNVIYAYRDNGSSDDYMLYMSGKLVIPDAPLLEVGGTFMSPIRVLAEGLRQKVSWNSITKQITFQSDTDTLVMTIGSNKFQFNGWEETGSVAPFIKDGRTYVPLELIVEKFGWKIGIDRTHKIIRVFFPADQNQDGKIDLLDLVKAKKIKTKGFSEIVRQYGSKSSY